MKVKGNVSDAILAQLAEWGVKRIYGVLGDAIFPLLDAMSRQDRIMFVPATSDVSAAFMASYEARLTGRLSVCAATSGPGAVSLLNGLADAHADGVPVLAITGQVEMKKMRPGTRQYFYQQAVFQPFTGSTVLLADPHSVVDTLVSAVRGAYLKSSPAHISVPRDILAGAVSLETAPPGSVDLKIFPFISGSVEPALKIINSAIRPMVVMGRQAAGVRQRVVDLAQKLGAGIITALDAKGIVEDGHDLSIGGIGEAGVPPVVGEADCFVVVGGAPYEWPFIPRGAGIVHIDERPERISQASDAGVAGDLEVILDLIIKGIDGSRAGLEWPDRVKDDGRRRRAEIQELAGAAPGHPLGIMSALGEVVPEGSVIVLDIGEFTHWFNLGFPGKKQTVLVSGLWRSIGAGLPGAIGAKFACPDRTVVALCGDGGMAVSMNEMLTCVRHRLAVTVIVLRNNSYGLEENKMRAQGLRPFGHIIQNPDFAGFAGACGADGYRAQNRDTLREAVRSAIESGRPALVEAACLPAYLPAAGTQ